MSDLVGSAQPRFGVQVASWPLGVPTAIGFYSELARHVEGEGFELFFAGDHIFGHNPIHESLTVLAYVAGAAPSLTVGTGVLLLALREPVVTAKQLATIDQLTGGRLIVGVGVGGEMEHEWRALGVPLDDRGARTDEYLGLVADLWSGDVVEHRGKFRIVQGVQGSPVPARVGGPPIWIGGRADAALRRAARHDGWCAYAVTPRRVRESLVRLRELRAGSDDDGFRISLVLFCYVDDDEEHAREVAATVLTKRYHQDFDRYLDAFCAVGSLNTVAERVREYLDAGVQDVLLCPQAPADQVFDQVRRLAAVVTEARR